MRRNRPERDPDVAWEITLDRLEVDLILAERLLRTLQAPPDLTRWDTPSPMAPVPEHLVPRARRLLARQETVLESLASALERARRQRELTDRVGQATSAPSRAIYVDATA